MADNIIPGGPPSAGGPSTEVAGVAAVLRIRIDRETTLRDLQALQASMRDEVTRMSKDLATGLSSSFDGVRKAAQSDPLGAYRNSLQDILSLQRQVGNLKLPSLAVPSISGGGLVSSAGVPLGNVGTSALDTQKQLIALDRTRLEIAQQFSRLANNQAQQQALALEASGLRGLIDDQKLLAAANDQAASRLNAIELAIKQAEAAENSLNAKLRIQIELEQQLAKVSGQPSEAKNIGAALLNDVEIQGKAELAARQKITQLLSADNAERKRLQQLGVTNLRQQTQQEAALRRQEEADARAQLARDKEVAEQRSKLFGGAFGGSLAGSFLGNFAANTLQNALQSVRQTFDGLVERAIAFDKKLETAQTRIRQFVQDTAQAQLLTNQIVNLALQSPFSVDELVNATGRLLAMGTAAGDVVGQVRTLSASLAAVGGNAGALSRVILDFGHIESSGTLQLRNLRALALNGIPVFSILEEKLHLTADQVQNIGRQGISAKEGLAALTSGLEERFGTGLILQLDTLKGASGNASTSIDILLGKATSPLATELKLFLQDLSVFLQDPNTVAAADALGSAIGDLAHNFREFLTGDTTGVIEFMRRLPTLIADVEIEFVKAQNLISGLPVIGTGDLQGAFDTNAAIDKINKGLNDAADAVAAKGAHEIKVHMDLVAEVGRIQADVARAQVVVSGADSIDLGGFSDTLIKKFDSELGLGLSDSALKGVNSFLDALSKDTGGDSPAARSMATVASQLGQVFIEEMKQLGSDPNAQQVQAAIADLGKKLIIPGQFGTTDSQADKDIIKLAQDTLELSVDTDQLAKITAKAKDEQLKATAASHDEQSVIETKTDAIKTLTDARKADSDQNKQDIQDLKDKITAEQQNVTNLKTSFDPIIAGLKSADDTASTALDNVTAHQQKVANGFASVIEQEGRIVRDLGDQRSVDEAKLQVGIDAATNAEKRNARAIKDAQLDLKEKVSVQDDIIAGVEAEYQGRLQIKDLAVDEQNRSLRAAKQEFDKQDLQFAQQILDARKRGDADAVKSLLQQREQARISFDESQDAARAELQVREDAAQALRDEAAAKEQTAKTDKATLEANAGKNITALQRQGETLADNTQKLKDEKDAALASFDAKIRIANLFSEVLKRTAADADTINKAQVGDAKTAKEKADAALKSEQEREATVLAGRQKIIDGINTEIDKLNAKEEAAQRASDAIVKPLQAELNKLTEQHKANDTLRSDEADKTKAVVEGVTARIAAINLEIAAIQERQKLQKTEDALATAREKDASAAEPGNVTVSAADTNALINKLVQEQPAAIRKDLQTAIQQARQGDKASFEEAARRIIELVFSAGKQSTLDAKAIANFLSPEVAAPPETVRVDPSVTEFLAELSKPNPNLDTISKLLGGDGFLAKLTQAITGTATSGPNTFAQQQLAAAIPLLESLDEARGKQLRDLLAKEGITVGAGGLSVPSVDTVARTASTSVFQQAVKDFSDAVSKDIANKGSQDVLGIVANALGIAGNNSILLQGGGFAKGIAKQSDIEHVLAGTGDFTNPNPEAFRATVLELLSEILADPNKSARLLAQIKANPAAFKALFDKLFPEGVNRSIFGSNIGLFGGSAQISDESFNAIKKAIDSALTDINKDAQTQGQKVAPNFIGPVKDPKSAAVVQQGAKDGIVAPFTQGLDGVVAAALAAAKAVVSTQGFGSLNSPENIKTIAGIVSDLDPTIGAGMAKAGTAGGKAGAAAVVGPLGLGSLASPTSFGVLKTITDLMKAEFSAQMAAVGATGAQSLASSFQVGLTAVTSALGTVEKTLGIIPGLGTPPGQGGNTLGLPLEGSPTVTQGFKPGAGAFEPGHTGIDFAANPGTPVHAVADGLVVFAGWANGDQGFHLIQGDKGPIRTQGVGFGLHVEILHLINGRRFASVYGHLSKLGVTKGQTVTKGTVIGLTGSTGFSTGGHLHLEFDTADASGAFSSKTAFNPLPFIQANRGGQGGGSASSTEGGVGDTSDTSLASLPSVNDALTLVGLSGGGLGTTPSTPEALARNLIRALLQIIKESGGDINAVIEAVLNGSSEIAKDKLKGVSQFAATQMQEALDALKAIADELPGGLSELQQLFGAEGLQAGTDPISQLLALLKEAQKAAGSGGFADALRRQLLLGSDMTVRQLAALNVAGDATSRRLLDFIEKNFGLDVPISSLAKSVVENGAIKDILTPSLKTPDPAAEEAARLIKEFALKNRFFTDEAGNKTQDPSITNLLNAIKTSEAKTLEDFLAQPNIANIGSDDTPLGQFVKLLRSLQATNPNITLSDLQGFLFGGKGFEATNAVDAANATTDAVNTQTAVLSQILLGLDPTDPVAIEIWKDMLTTFRAVQPDLGTTADATQQTADATQQTADNTTPPPPGTPGTPGGPAAPLPPATKAVFDDVISLNKDLRDILIGGHKLGSLPIGIPEAGQTDLRGAFGQGEGNPADLRAVNGILTNIAGDVPQALVDFLTGGLKGQQAQDSQKTAAQLISDRIKAEIEARGQANKLIQDEIVWRSRLLGQTPPAGLPAGAGTGGGGGNGDGSGNGVPGGGGGGGPRTFGSGNTFITVTEANDAHFVSAKVADKLRWAERARGG